jgi:hypothetical protein
MAEASQKSVLHKLLLKPGQRAAVLNAPASYEPVVTQVPDASRSLDGHFDFLHVFATRREELLREGPKWRAAMAPNALLWVSYPEGKSIPTDLNRDIVRTTLNEVGLDPVSQVAIDDVFSALRCKPV